ncbi:AraC family transcriptional regulator [Pseudonocardia xinjiangensis]|uniref:AraC family transcriptional regulator n=1 Tax=Pseudonocardia xinjiangensis TaxID=75289 RepID=UPI003D914F1C
MLAHREICRSSQVDVFTDRLNSLFYPAQRVRTRTPRPDLSESLLRAARLDHVTVAFVRFGTEAMLDAGALGAYHVNVPLSGRVASACGPRESVATPARGAVFTPREHAALPSWDADASQICIKIEKSALEAELEALLGHPIGGDVRFELAMDLTSPHAQSWLSVLRLILSELDRPSGLLEHSKSHRGYLEKLLISGLLQTQAHDHLDELRRPVPQARPRTVKRVVDLIEADPRANYTVADLARHAGVGARRLQMAFQESLNTSPTGYLRKVKLARARADLLASGETVMSVAYRWGFNHPGRFSAAYRSRYGESPSDTLRRGRFV